MPGTIDSELAMFPPALRAKLANPADVKRASLKNRDLRAIPKRLLACKNLTHLDLEDNRDIKLDQLAAHFPALQHLNLDSTNIASLDSLRGLVKLRSLSLRYTQQLASLPAWLGELAEIEELSLTATPLRAFPAVLAKLPKLKRLWLWHWFGPPKLLAEAVRVVGALHLEAVGFIQGNQKKLPSDLSPLAKIPRVDMTDLGLPGEERSRARAAIAGYGERWPAA